MAFEPNQGQAPADRKFVTKGHGFTLSLKGQELMFVQTACQDTPDHNEPAASPAPPPVQPTCQPERSVVHMRFVGASPNVTPVASDLLPGTVGYATDKDPSKWIPTVPMYATVTYPNMYPGIDLVLHGDATKLKYDFVVYPGAEPDAIQIDWQGTQDGHLDIDGNFVFETRTGTATAQKPNVYQVVAGRQINVEASYVLLKGTKLAFHLGPYDHAVPLIIDPVFVFAYSAAQAQYSGYHPNAAAVDSSGNLFVIGVTASESCAVLDSFGNTVGPPPGDTTYLAKFDASGSLRREYIIGCGSMGSSLALDSAEDIYIAGGTQSPVWYTSANAYQSTPSYTGPSDTPLTAGYIAKFDHNLSQRLYGTYLGTYGWIASIKIDNSGNAVLTGAAYTWPTTSNAYRSTNPSPGNSTTIFTKLNQDGSQLLYSTYFGGSGGTSTGVALALDSGGNAYIAGSTASSSLPLVTEIQTAVGPGFIARFDSSNNLTYSTYFVARPHNIALDRAGNVWISGATSSAALPLVNPIQTTRAGSSDVFVTKLNLSSNTILYSTYFGGSFGESELWETMALDSADNAYVTFQAGDADLPSIHSVQPQGYMGMGDAYVIALNPAGALAFASYIGGSELDYPTGIAIDSRALVSNPNGIPNIYLFGGFWLGGGMGLNFPVVGSASLGSDIEGFLVKLGPPGTTPTTTYVNAVPVPSNCGQLVTFTVTVSAASGALGGRLYLLDGTKLLGSPWNLSGTNSQTFTYPTASLGPGTHNISATYSGDPTFAPSNANVQVTVGSTACPTVTTLSVYPDNSSSDFPATVTIVVSPGADSFGTPGGTVDVYANGQYDSKSIGPVTLNGGRATLTLPATLAPGTYSIGAHFLGTAGFAESLGNAPACVMGLTLSSSAGTRAQIDQPVAFTASLAGGAYVGYVPTGTVSFDMYPQAGGVVTLGPTKPLNSAANYTVNGSATSDQRASSETTTYGVVAHYSGDSNYPAATSPTLMQHIGPGAPTTTALIVPKSFAGSDQTLDLAIRVKSADAGTPTGTVKVMDGTSVVVTVDLIAAMANVARTFSPGIHNLTATYNGDAIYDPSTSAPVSLTITIPASTVMTQMANTMWGTAAIPTDAVITATMTRHFATGDFPTGVVIKLKAQDKYKFQESGAPVTAITNGNAGGAVARDGTKFRLPPAAAKTLRGPILPVLSQIQSWSNGSYSIAVVGQKTIGSDPCIGVQITQIFFMNLVPPGTVVEPTVTVWVSTVSYRILQVDYVRLSADNGSAGTNITVLFSDLRSVDGILVPFHQEESVEGQNTISIQFADNGVLFNNGLSDSEFSVAALLGGGQ